MVSIDSSRNGSNGASIRALDFSSLHVGDKLPPLQFGTISRHILALYCGGSGDHNPIHVDRDFAQAAGYKDVFAHGMLSMAILGRMLTNWTAQENIKTFSVRFSAITQVLDEVTAAATISEKNADDGEQRLTLEIETRTQTGVKTLTGSAIVVVPTLKR